MTKPPTIDVYQRPDGLYDWHMVGANGEVMCGSTQGYTERNDAYEGWLRVKRAAIAQPEVRGLD